MDINVAQESTIKDLFSTFLTKDEQICYFSIPLYQRKYSWSEKQWEELFSDLFHSFAKADMNTDYWGNIIVYKKDSENNYELVDGQQRIITLLLLIASLGNIEKNDGYLPLKFNDEQNSVWVKIAENSGLTQDEKRHPFNRAKKYFTTLVSEQAVDKQALLDHLLRTKISVVIVNDELESNLLFGRLNTRGISLNDVDLIKHNLFYATKRSLPPTGEDVVLQKWNNLVQTTSQINISTDDFISKWWEIHYELSELGLYASFQNQLDASEYLNFLDSLLSVATEIKKLRVNNSGSDNKIGRNLKWLLKLSHSKQLLSIIISVQETTFGSKVSLFELLTVFEFIRAISPQTDFSELEEEYLRFSKTLLSEVSGNRLTEREILVEIDKLKGKMRKLLPDPEDFFNSFTKLRCDDSNRWEGSRHEKMLSTYAIYTLNNWLDVINHGAGAEYRTKDDDEYSIEHIRAKKNATYGELSPEYLIGNLVVFEKQPNNDLEDIDVEEKISAYRKSSYPQMKELIVKYKRNYSPSYRTKNAMEWDIKDFTIDAIENRGRYLASCFYDKTLELLE
ncbi:DUF262 domain-containing protein [Streptococcus parasanguinis]|uniref:DUF262 domain-containing protein n=1 Tax=Streptococcus parasanguinis TaxID=1318 RepID=UPI00214FB843|nr:DUF262 domain-containing protein [Streptococcus parasanguinis]MCR4485456.1 DUF262 domain-containing protein [Streptococcus parasanguinis]